MTEKSRVLASLKGLATGDAIGKQTESLSRDGIAQWYPRGVHGFEGHPGTVIPRYASNRKRQWLFGEIPNGLTMLGAGIIIASTLYITIRESRLGVPKTPPVRTE